MSKGHRTCEVCGIKERRSENEMLFSKFPLDLNRCREWLKAVGNEELVHLPIEKLHQQRNVCANHFGKKYFNKKGNRLKRHAIPTLHLMALPLTDRQLSEFPQHLYRPKELNLLPPATEQTENIQEVQSDLLPEAVPSTSQQTRSVLSELSQNEQTHTESHKRSGGNVENKAKIRKLSQAKSTLNLLNLQRTIKKLQQKKDSYATRLNKAYKLCENTTFQKCLQKFTSLATLFTVMQFPVISNRKIGRKFTKEEKVMALSLYKQGAKAYKWVNKIFFLPSATTLSRLISCAGLRPGLNKNIFAQLKKKVHNMTEKEKLCILLFNEMSLLPHYDLNSKTASITRLKTKRNQADHVLVFMLRGLMNNYKQPLAYTFCRGTISSEDLKLLIKNIITELQQCGLNVIATVCDHKSTNISVINELVEETRIDYINKKQNFNHQIFEINGEVIIPLFDPPHLIIGIRNNLLTKDLKCIIDGEVKIAKWDHLIKLFEENPSYKGIKLLKNLTESHIEPKKNPKMQVKMATQIISQTVAVTMGYLAEKRILPVECKNTAEVFMFFDELFDSVNGSRDNSKDRSGKVLLRAVTRKSNHSKVWARAKNVLKSMKFVTKEGREGRVPSITNWLRTLDNIEVLKVKLFNEHNVKSFWMRHLNLDPLENYFSSIRSHGNRNTSPTLSGFESAFASLLINNLSINHSVESNCEEDDCKILINGLLTEIE